MCIRSYVGCQLADVADTLPIPSPSNLPQGCYPPSHFLAAAGKQWLDYYRHNPTFYELWTLAYAKNPRDLTRTEKPLKTSNNDSRGKARVKIMLKTSG